MRCDAPALQPTRVQRTLLRNILQGKKGEEVRERGESRLQPHQLPGQEPHALRQEPVQFHLALPPLRQGQEFSSTSRTHLCKRNRVRSTLALLLSAVAGHELLPLLPLTPPPLPPLPLPSLLLPSLPLLLMLLLLLLLLLLLPQLLLLLLPQLLLLLLQAAAAGASAQASAQAALQGTRGHKMAHAN